MKAYIELSTNERQYSAQIEVELEGKTIEEKQVEIEDEYESILGAKPTVTIV